MELLDLAEEYGQVVIYALEPEPTDRGPARFKVVAGTDAVDGWEDASAEGTKAEIAAAIPRMIDTGSKGDS